MLVINYNLHTLNYDSSNCTIVQETHPAVQANEGWDSPSFVQIKEEPTEITVLKQEYEDSEDTLEESQIHPQEFFECSLPPPIVHQAKRLKTNNANITNIPNVDSCRSNEMDTATKSMKPEKFQSIGMYVTAKLQEMSSHQACLAEALINEILFKGSLNSLTLNTRITHFDNND